MSALHFYLDLPPRHRRHPLVRIVMGILGLGLLAVLVFFSVFVGAAMLAAGLLYRLLRKRPQTPARDPQVVEGEFRVVGRT